MGGEFTDLERVLLDLIVTAEPSIGARLREILATARVTGRENTGHGFFTAIATDTTMPGLQWKYRHISGPDVRVDVGGSQVLMGAILFLEDGHPNCLEGFQYAYEVDLRRHDLTEIRFLGARDDDAI